MKSFEINEIDKAETPREAGKYNINRHSQFILTRDQYRFHKARA